MCAFQSVYCSGQSIVSQVVSSVYCLSVLMSLISHLYGAGSQQSNAKIYVTSGCQCLENLYQFKAFMEQSS